MPPGTPIRLGAGPAGPRSRITVADGGPGIPTTHLGQVFEPFFTTARDRGGTGLGLPIARALLTAAGGAIDLASAPHGTTLLIDLPQQPSGTR